MNPYRNVDAEHRRLWAIHEAQRIRDALAGTPRFHNVANGQIRSSQEIVDAINNLLEQIP